MYNLRFNVMERQLTVEHVLANDEPLLVALQEIGMAPAPRAARTNGHSLIFWVRLAISGGLAVVCELLSHLGQDSRLVAAMALLSMALSGGETFGKGWLALRSFNLNINFLMSVAQGGHGDVSFHSSGTGRGLLVGARPAGHSHHDGAFS